MGCLPNRNLVSTAVQLNLQGRPELCGGGLQGVQPAVLLLESGRLRTPELQGRCLASLLRPVIIAGAWSMRCTAHAAQREPLNLSLHKSTALRLGLTIACNAERMCAHMFAHLQASSERTWMPTWRPCCTTANVRLEPTPASRCEGSLPASLHVVLPLCTMSLFWADSLQGPFELTINFKGP